MSEETDLNLMEMIARVNPEAAAAEIARLDKLVGLLQLQVKLGEGELNKLRGLIKVWVETGKGIILNDHQTRPEYIAAANALREVVEDD